MIAESFVSFLEGARFSRFCSILFVSILQSQQSLALRQRHDSDHHRTRYIATISLACQLLCPPSCISTATQQHTRTSFGGHTAALQSQMPFACNTSLNAQAQHLPHLTHRVSASQYRRRCTHRYAFADTDHQGDDQSRVAHPLGGSCVSETLGSRVKGRSWQLLRQRPGRKTLEGRPEEARGRGKFRLGARKAKEGRRYSEWLVGSRKG
jgi:hypothetical protein